MEYIYFLTKSLVQKLHSPTQVEKSSFDNLFSSVDPEIREELYLQGLNNTRRKMKQPSPQKSKDSETSNYEFCKINENRNNESNEINNPENDSLPSLRKSVSLAFSEKNKNEFSIETLFKTEIYELFDNIMVLFEILNDEYQNYDLSFLSFVKSIFNRIS